jgi:membrane protease YdiL (CAAX protease family)
MVHAEGGAKLGDAWRKLAPLAIVAVVAACNAVAWSADRAGTRGFALWSMLPTIVLAAIGAWWLWREDGDLQLLAPKWGDASLAIVCALALFGGAWLMVHVLAPAGSPREAWMARLYLQFGPGGDLKKQMVVVVAGLVAIAIGEEVLWRGVVTRLLEPLVGSRRAWIVSAFLYALAHLPTVFLLADDAAGHNPMLVLGALGAGLVWGGLARRLGRLSPGILSHVAFDWTVLVLFRLWGKGL